MRQSRLGSWLLFAASVGLFGWVLWARLFATPPHGEWRSQLEGTIVGALPLVDGAGEDLSLSHPAVFYFYSDRCRFCPPAAERISTYLSRTGPAGIPVYALTNFGRLPPATGEPFDAQIQVVRLTRTTPNLNFVKEVPLLVRTDEDGKIQRAYVGIAADSVLAALLAPRRAGPVSR